MCPIAGGYRRPIENLPPSWLLLYGAVRRVWLPNFALNLVARVGTVGIVGGDVTNFSDNHDGDDPVGDWSPVVSVTTVP